MAAQSWGPMDMGLGDAGDLPKPDFSNDQSSALISVPGEGAVEDEMAAINAAPVRPQKFLNSNEVAAQRPMQPMVLMNNGEGATFDAPSGPLAAAQYSSMAQSPTAPQVSKVATKVVEEYDSGPDDEQVAQEDDQYRTTKMTEAQSREVEDRQQTGDVEHVVPTVHPTAKIQIRKLKLATAAQKVSKAVVKEAEVAEQAPGNDKMLGQCMAFANWVKSQGSTGPDLVRIWGGTCMPAVMAGDAPPAYGNMCTALKTAVSKFAVAPWAPADMCQAVLQVFKESGVGASPLR